MSFTWLFQKAVYLSFHWFNDSWTRNSWIWTRNSRVWVGTFEFRLVLLSFWLVLLSFQLITRNSQFVTRVLPYHFCQVLRKFEINLNVLIKPFFYITKRSRQKLKYLLTWYKKHFSSFLKGFHWSNKSKFFGRWKTEFRKNTNLIFSFNLELKYQRCAVQAKWNVFWNLSQY